ncbi:COG1361 S-layer family protein [Halobacterium salinarum]|nr:COG1361 S-layer family protein [Halobacterium salinarum]MCF2240827.1 COG1361 S-layer family protein [Halobacterium salinarum]
MFDSQSVSKHASRITVLAVVVLITLSAVPLSVSAADNTVTGKPDISLSSPDGPVAPESAHAFTVTVSNSGTLIQGGQDQYEREVQTAEALKLDIATEKLDANITPKSGTYTISSLPSGQGTDVKFQLEVGDVEPGTYRIPIDVAYEHTRSVSYGRFQEASRTKTEEESTQYVDITIEDQPQFSIVSQGENEIYGGDTGQLSLDVKNTGTETATDASVQLSSQSPTLYFGQMTSPQPKTSVYIPALDPGETANISAKVGAESNADAGDYPINAVVAYTNSNGVTRKSQSLTAGVSVQPERTFELRNVDTEKFRVDESDAEIHGEIVNTGSGSANNVAVRLGSIPGIEPTNGESAVGDLAPGESKPVSFTVAIPGSAEPGSNSFPFNVEYENDNGDVRTISSPLRQPLEIGAERDPFEVVNVSTSVSPGGSDTVAVSLRYQGDEPVSAANAKLFVSDPLSTSDDGAYLGELQPGETTTATFTASADSAAITKEYDASVEVRYDEPDGDTKYTDGLTVGVPVSPQSGGLPVPLPVIIGLVVVVAGVGYVLYQRR